MKLKSIFQIIQGHQITDEEIYKAEGNIPVITGKNEIKGYWNKKIIERGDLPCITYPTKANAGKTYIQTKIFDANNTAVLIPFPEWRKKIDLEWISYKLRTMFLKIQTSKAGVSYLNKGIVEELEINIPSQETQKKEKEVISKLWSVKNKICEILKVIEKIKSSPIIIKYNKYQGREIPVKKIFKVISGNSGLTEEYIYSIMLNRKNRKYKVLTGSEDTQNVKKVYLCPHPKKTEKKINIFFGEGIHIVRKGKAGLITYLPKGHYTLNDDAYILAIKDNCDYEISLKWVVNTDKNLFLEYASQSDNSTWNKTGFFKHASFDAPSIKEQHEIVKRFEVLQNYENKLSSINNKIDFVLNKEISEENPDM